ncbi:hypothetical protein CYJ46_05325 [Corynebacterium coyleae]|uniref:DUF6036 family nucleotidyltransferase n=1 Tax=Corynebacterium coyleae TaxID=53374 RepID=UPI000C78C0FD|nr:DUF6036 family nucleotidyltransferase [Corynebacterium coyleae]PLA37950.1 hypothetical protein CYJ46_05325 [Corynebacterium coyleae]
MDLTRDELLHALAELEKQLGNQGAKATLRVIGGAAIALRYDATRATADIDSVFGNYRQVRNAVEETAVKLGLPTDWVNSQVHDLGLPFSADHSPDLLVIGPNLTVEIASAEFLLFTKVVSTRQAEQDLDDAVVLAKHLGLRNAQDIEQVVKQFGSVDGPVELFVEDIAAEL